MTARRTQALRSVAAGVMLVTLAGCASPAPAKITTIAATVKIASTMPSGDYEVDFLNSHHKQVGSVTMEAGTNALAHVAGPFAYAHVIGHCTLWSPGPKMTATVTPKHCTLS